MDGFCDPRFAPVEAAFAEVLGRSAAGSAVAVWHDGDFVVDLWGGWADAGRTIPWARDTLVMPYSVSKPFAAVCALRLVADGRLDLDAAANTYWPQLRCGATVRQLLDHSAGLVLLDRPAPTSAFFDWDDMCARVAEQEPEWAPGSGVGESALLYGHPLGEIVRRVDGRRIGAFLREEVCQPLGLDVHLGVEPDDLPRVADLVAAPGFPADGGGPLRQAALANPPGATDMRIVNSPEWRMAEIPAVNTHVTARGVAGFYAALATGDLLPAELVRELSRVQAAGDDAVTGSHTAWGLGVAVEADGWGMGGLGGSLGWWSEQGRYAFGFVTAYLDEHDRSAHVENAARRALQLPPL